MGYHSVTITRINLLAGKSKHLVDDVSTELKYGANKVIHIGLAKYKLNAFEVTAVEVAEVNGKVNRISTRSLREKMRKLSKL
jgi:hypothetical protein